MKRLVIAATVVAMFLGNSAFAGDKKTAPQGATTENVMPAGKKAKKAHKSKKAKKIKKMEADANTSK